MIGYGQLFILVNFTTILWQGCGILSNRKSERQTAIKEAKQRQTVTRDRQRENQVEIMSNEQRAVCSHGIVAFCFCLLFAEITGAHSVRITE